MEWQEEGVEQGAEFESCPEAVEAACDALKSLAERMCQTDLDEFELVSSGRGREGGREG